MNINSIPEATTVRASPLSDKLTLPSSYDLINDPLMGTITAYSKSYSHSSDLGLDSQESNLKINQNYKNDFPFNNLEAGINNNFTQYSGDFNNPIINPTINNDSNQFNDIGTTSLDIPYLSEADIDFYLFGKTQLDKNSETYIITHGWRSHGIQESGWTDLASSVKIRNQDANIIFADWSDIGTNLNYFQAAHDTEAVGNAIAQFLYFQEVDPTQTTAIGHSLGAHVSGNIGEKFNELTGNFLNMIIGLDPAGPNFEDINGSNASTRLDETDANRVVAFHSTKTLGYGSSLGDVDFYLNNWDDFDHRQPGQGNFIDDHGYPIEVLDYLYRGLSYTQPDGSVFDYSDILEISSGSYDITTA